LTRNDESGRERAIATVERESPVCRFDLSRRDFIALLIPCAVAAVLLVRLSFFSFPQADDYCVGASLQKRGFLETQKRWYRGVNGRFAATAAFSLAALVLWDHYWVFGTATMGLLLFSFWFLARTYMRQWAGPRVQFAVAAGLFAVYWACLPSVSQVIYWLSGGATYMGGAVLAMLLLGLLIGRVPAQTPGRRVVQLVPFGVLALAAGFQETLMVVLLCLLGIGFARSILQTRRNRLDWAVALAIAVAAALLLMQAPGTAHRQAVEIGEDGSTQPIYLAARSSFIMLA
jgi:uncharacterized membrane protein